MRGPSPHTSRFVMKSVLDICLPSLNISFPFILLYGDIFLREIRIYTPFLRRKKARNVTTPPSPSLPLFPPIYSILPFLPPHRLGWQSISWLSQSIFASPIIDVSPF